MDLKRTICFSGHRSKKFTFPLTPEYPEYIRLLEATRKAIIDSIEDDYGNFMVGMAGGFDLIAASAFYEFKDAGMIPENVRFTAVLPFTGHRPTKDWLEIHQAVLEEADEVVTIAPKFSTRSYLELNRYMVDRSSRLICYCRSLTGGTAYTVKYAAQNGRQIINVAELEAGSDPIFFITNF